MKVKNTSSSVAIITDMVTSGQGLMIFPNQEITLYDEDTEKSAVLKQYIADGIIEVTGYTEPAAGVGKESPEITYGVIAPTSTPARVGDLYVNTATSRIYFANGTTSSANWIYANTGAAGPKGDTGTIGVTGLKGDTGTKGDTGAKGDTGI